MSLVLKQTKVINNITFLFLPGTREQKLYFRSYKKA